MRRTSVSSSISEDKKPESKLTRRPSIGKVLARASSMIMSTKITDKPPEPDEFKAALQYSDSVDEELRRACEWEIKLLKEKTDDPKLPDAVWEYTARMLQNRVDATFLTRDLLDSKSDLPAAVTSTMKKNERRLTLQDPQVTAQKKKELFEKQIINRDAEQKKIAEKEAKAKAAERAAASAAIKAKAEAEASDQKYIAPPKKKIQRELTEDEKIDLRVKEMLSQAKKVDHAMYYNPIAAIEQHIDTRKIPGLTGITKDSNDILNKVARDLDAYTAKEIPKRREKLENQKKGYEQWRDQKEKTAAECKILLDEMAVTLENLKSFAAITETLIPELKSGKITAETLQRAKEFERLFYEVLAIESKLRTTTIMLETVQAIVDQRPFVIQHLHDKFDLESNLETEKPLPFIDRRSALNYFLAYNQPKLMAMAFKNLMNTTKYLSEFEGKKDEKTIQAAIAFLYQGNPAAHMPTPESAREMRICIHAFMMKGGDTFEPINPVHRLVNRSCLALTVERFNLLEQLKLEAATASPKGAGSKRRTAAGGLGSQSLHSIDEKHAHKSVSKSAGATPGSPAPISTSGHRTLTTALEPKDTKKSPSERRRTTVTSPTSTTHKPSPIRRTVSTTASLGKVIGSESLITPFNPSIEPAQSQAAPSSTADAKKEIQQTIDLPGTVPESEPQSPTKKS